MKNPQSDIKSEKRFASFVSSITHPPLVSIPTFALINYFILGFDESITITGICLFFGAFLPVFTSLILIKKMDTDIDITDRTKRTLPLFLAVSSYIIGAIMLYTAGAPAVTIALMFTYFSNTLIILFINLSWKISIHAMGVAGPTAALTYVFGIPGAVFGIIIPVVMWSRLKLHKHTPTQVVAGALLGLVLTAAQLYLITPII